jgi:hypothetical protein
MQHTPPRKDSRRFSFCFLAHILPDRGLDVAHRSVVAGRLDEVLVAMVFPPLC